MKIKADFYIIFKALGTIPCYFEKEVGDPVIESFMQNNAMDGLLEMYARESLDIQITNWKVEK